MRLIDADKIHPDCMTKDGKLAISQSQLANAPTVEANSIIDGLNNEIDDLSENLVWYINERNRLLKERRPQGEWISNCTSQFSNSGRHCSLCGKVVEFSENFCPNCGADMRGGEA